MHSSFKQKLKNHKYYLNMSDIKKYGLNQVVLESLMGCGDD